MHRHFLLPLLALGFAVAGPAYAITGESPAAAAATLANKPAAPAAPPVQKPFLLSDSPLEGFAVTATFHFHLMWGGIKTLTIADVWGARAIKAGLKNGDRILRIQGKSVDGMNVVLAKLLIDPIGNRPTISLEVQHADGKPPVEIDLPRGPQGGKA